MASAEVYYKQISNSKSVILGMDQVESSIWTIPVAPPQRCLPTPTTEVSFSHKLFTLPKKQKKPPFTINNHGEI